MLINEIGRFGDNIEDILPSQLADEIPPNLKKGKVGIFWHVGDNKWIIVNAPVLDDRQNAVEMGQDYDEDTNPEDIQIDFNSFHKDIWREQIVPKFPEFKDLSFEHFSRGRIIYEVKKQKYSIFLPKIENFPQEAILFLARMFDLPLGGWETNYTIYKKKADAKTLTAGKNEKIN